MISKNDPQLLAYRSARTPKLRRSIAGRLYIDNEPLVRRLVKKLSRFAPASVEFDDLMQAGAIGFLYTIDHIDPAKTFSTYLAYRIWYEVSKCIEKSETIYRPRGTGMPFKVLKKIETFRTQYGREPRPEEIGCTQAQMDKWAAMPTTTSMDVELGEGASVHDILPDSRPDVETTMIRKETRREQWLELSASGMDLIAEECEMPYDEFVEAWRELSRSCS